MIPKEVFTIYETFADSMIEDLGTTCLVKYPSAPVATATNVPLFKTSKTLRPYDSSPDDTLIHDGEQIKADPVTDTLKLRVYWTPKEFVKVGGMLYPDAKVQTIGYYSDIEKIRQCVELCPDPEKGFSLVLVGTPIPWGMRKSRYFVAFWKMK